MLQEKVHAGEYVPVGGGGSFGDSQQGLFSVVDLGQQEGGEFGEWPGVVGGCGQFRVQENVDVVEGCAGCDLGDEPLRFVCQEKRGYASFDASSGAVQAGIEGLIRFDLEEGCKGVLGPAALDGAVVQVGRVGVVWVGYGG